MNGHFIRGTPIAVDVFRSPPGGAGEGPDGYGQVVYFLSHAHTDHMAGLTHTWRSGNIYMTDITARLVIHQRKVDKKWLKVLEVGESKMIQLQNTAESFVVTPIDARHCAGSVMFLFQGKFGNVLYTGDLRFCDPSMLDNEALRQCSYIHRLYLDNTYCEPACQFPSRDEATEELINLISSVPDCRVFLGVVNLGKEDLLVQVARHFRTPIVVTEETYHFYQAMKTLPTVFSTDPNASRIHAVGCKELVRRAREKDADDDCDDDDLLIMPTAIQVGTKDPGLKLIKQIVDVPYSNHSSFKELLAFVAAVKPRQVIPIVDYPRRLLFGCDVSKRLDMSVFDHLLDTRPMQINPVVQKIEMLISTTSIRSQVDDILPKPGIALNDPSQKSSSTLSSAKCSAPRRRRRIMKTTPRKGVVFSELSPPLSCDGDFKQIIHYVDTSSSEVSPTTAPGVLSYGKETVLKTSHDEIPDIGEEVQVGDDDSDTLVIFERLETDDKAAGDKSDHGYSLVPSVVDVLLQKGPEVTEMDHGEDAVSETLDIVGNGDKTSADPASPSTALHTVKDVELQKDSKVKDKLENDDVFVCSGSDLTTCQVIVDMDVDELWRLPVTTCDPEGLHSSVQVLDKSSVEPFPAIVSSPEATVITCPMDEPPSSVVQVQVAAAVSPEISHQSLQFPQEELSLEVAAQVLVRNELPNNALEVDLMKGRKRPCTCTCKRRRRRKKPTKHAEAIRREWEELERIFNRKRLTNEIPLYWTKPEHFL